jgi:FHS family Na+ dependent glucose MFS transporter 1
MVVPAKFLEQYGAEKLRITAGYFTAFVALGFVQASLGPTLPGLAEHVHAQIGDLSFLFVARAIGYLTGSFLGGRLFDRLRGHPVMAVVLGMITLTVFVIPLTSTLWALAAALLTLGMAESVLDVGGNTLLMRLHRHKVGPFMNGLHLFFGLGAFLSPIIIAQAVLLTGDITWAYWTLAILVLPVGAWIIRLPNPSTLNPSVSTETTKPESGNQAIPVSSGRRLIIILISIFFFLYVGTEIGFGGWIFTYAVTLGLANETMAAYLTSAFWGAFTVGRLVAVPIAVRFEPAVILLANLIGVLLSVALVLLWPGWPAMVWLGTIGAGFWMASIFPNTLSLAGRSFEVTGRVTGWFFAGASLGAMSLPWLIGQLFESVGPRVLMWAILGNTAVALVMFGVLWLVIRNNPAPAVSLDK